MLSVTSMTNKSLGKVFTWIYIGRLLGFKKSLDNESQKCWESKMWLIYSSGFQPGVGDIWQNLETFLIVTAGVCACMHACVIFLERRGQGCCWPVYEAQHSPTTLLRNTAQLKPAPPWRHCFLGWLLGLGVGQGPPCSLSAAPEHPPFHLPQTPALSGCP